MNIKHSSLSNNIYEKNLLKNKYMYFADWQANNGDFEYFLQYLFHFFIFEGDIVIDVGANHALHTIPLGNIVGSKGKVFAFEAIPENVKLIKNLTEHLSVTVFHSAVTNENTAEAKREIIFNHVINNDGYSGIKENPDISQIETIKKIKCPTTTLDRSIPENHTIKFIKIDVEGGEFHVLQGAKRILRKSKPIIAFENGRQQSASLYEYTKEDFFSFFKAFKYRIFCLTGEEITEESWDQENILWEFLAVHEDSPYIYFFENNLFYLANIYTERQRQYAEIIRTQALSCFKNSIATDYANPDTKRDAALQPCRKLYLHIGLPALDTVRYLQRALFRNRDILHSLDIFCPSEGEGQAPITPWDRDGGLADCVRDWNASGCSTAVFSHEAAVWTPPERYAFLAEQAEVRIVLHLPSPLFWLEAQQRDITEHALDWYAEERFPAHPRPDVDTGLLGLADWLRRWREYYPNGTCLVKNLDALETPEHVLQDFLELLGIADASTRFDTRVIPTRRHLNTEHLHFLAHTHFMPLSSDDRRGLLQSLHALSEAAPETPRLRLIREIPAAPALEALNAEFDILVGDPYFSSSGLKRFLALDAYSYTQLPTVRQEEIFQQLPCEIQETLRQTLWPQEKKERHDLLRDIPENINGPLVFKNTYNLSVIKDSTLISELQELLKNAFDSNSSEFADASYHLKRYAHTLKYLQKHKIYKGNVFEAGGKGFSTVCLNKYFPGYIIYHFEGDLREHINFSDKYFDIIIAMEIFEHISDVKGNRETHFDGIINMLMEFRRILKNNGKILITTPNASGYSSINRIIKGYHPFMYGLHFREYTPKELNMIFEYAGFSIIDLQTDYVWTNESYEPMQVNNIKLSNPYLMGDDIFMLVEKKDIEVNFIELQQKIMHMIIHQDTI